LYILDFPLLDDFWRISMHRLSTPCRLPARR
jgi:hypothetical protein